MKGKQQFSPWAKEPVTDNDIVNNSQQSLTPIATEKVENKNSFKDSTSAPGNMLESNA
jgi:hypothetical protein